MNNNKTQAKLNSSNNPQSFIKYRHYPNLTRTQIETYETYKSFGYGKTGAIFVSTEKVQQRMPSQTKNVQKKNKRALKKAGYIIINQLSLTSKGQKVGGGSRSDVLIADNIPKRIIHYIYERLYYEAAWIISEATKKPLEPILEKIVHEFSEDPNHPNNYKKSTDWYQASIIKKELNKNFKLPVLCEKKLNRICPEIYPLATPSQESAETTPSQEGVKTTPSILEPLRGIIKSVNQCKPDLIDSFGNKKNFKPSGKIVTNKMVPDKQSSTKPSADGDHPESAKKEIAFEKEKKSVDATAANGHNATSQRKIKYKKIIMLAEAEIAKQSVTGITADDVRGVVHSLRTARVENKPFATVSDEKLVFEIVHWYKNVVANVNTTNLGGYLVQCMRNNSSQKKSLTPKDVIVNLKPHFEKHQIKVEFWGRGSEARVELRKNGSKMEYYISKPDFLLDIERFCFGSRLINDAETWFKLTGLNPEQYKLCEFSEKQIKRYAKQAHDAANKPPDSSIDATGVSAHNCDKNNPIQGVKTLGDNNPIKNDQYDRI